MPGRFTDYLKVSDHCVLGLGIFCKNLIIQAGRVILDFGNCLQDIVQIEADPYA